MSPQVLVPWAAILLLTAIGCPSEPDDDVVVEDDSVSDDDASGDDDTAGDDEAQGDDDSVGDDDTTMGDDDSVGDDDTSMGDDDSVGDDDTSMGDDDSTTGDTWSDTLPITSATSLVVGLDRGSLEVVGSSTATEAFVEASFSGGVSTEYDQVVILLAEIGPAASVSVTIPPALGAVAVDLTVTFPEALGWTLSNLAGSIDASGLRGGGQASATTALALGFSAWTGGIVAATTGSGPTTVTVPAATSTYVTANTGTGTVIFQNLALNGVNWNGAATGTIGAGPSSGSITLTASTGDITVVGL
jgi:hypothetical protein